MLNKLLTLLMIIVILSDIYLGVRAIYFSNDSLGWTAAIGGVLGGLGAIGAILFAVYSLYKNQADRENDILRIEKYNYREDVRRLIEKGEAYICNFTYKKFNADGNMDSEKKSVDALELVFDLYTAGSIKVMIMNTSKISGLYGIYSSLLLKIYKNNDDVKFLESLFLCRGNPKCLFNLLFIISLRNNDEEISELLYNKDMFGGYELRGFCSLLVKNIVSFSEDDDEGSLSYLFSDIEKILSLSNSSIIYIYNILQIKPSDLVKKFNTIANEMQYCHVNLDYNEKFHRLGIKNLTNQL